MWIPLLTERLRSPYGRAAGSTFGVSREDQTFKVNKLFIICMAFGLVHDVGTQIKICKIRKKICFRIAVIRRLFTCSSSNERHLVAIFM